MADRPPGASSGKPIKMQDGEPQHHDGSFRKYMETKLRKLGEQFDAQTGSGGAESTLFAGVAIYVNGLTRPSHAELKTIMAQHGGRFSNYYSRSSITHIICENLPDAKVKQYERERSPTPVVRPEWIVRCLEQGRLLPINDFALWQLRDAPGQLTLKGFAAGGALPQGPQPPNPVSAAVSGVDAAPSIPPPAPRPEVAAAQGAQRRTYNAQELAVAHEIAAKMRSECDVLKGPPRSSKDDPNFVETYYRASRLHFIGSWKARLEALMVSVAASEAPDPAAWTLGKARTIMHLDMVSTASGPVSLYNSSPCT